MRWGERGSEGALQPRSGKDSESGEQTADEAPGLAPADAGVKCRGRRGTGRRQPVPNCGQLCGATVRSPFVLPDLVPRRGCKDRAVQRQCLPLSPGPAGQPREGGQGGRPTRGACGAGDFGQEQREEVAQVRTAGQGGRGE